MLQMELIPPSSKIRLVGHSTKVIYVDLLVCCCAFQKQILHRKIEKHPSSERLQPGWFPASDLWRGQNMDDRAQSTDRYQQDCSFLIYPKIKLLELVNFIADSGQQNTALSSYVRPSVTGMTSHIFSSISPFRPYKPNIFLKLMTHSIH